MTCCHQYSDNVTASSAPDPSPHEELLGRFRELHRLTISEHATYPELYADYLTTGRRLLGLGTGIVSHISADQYTILAVQPENSGFASGDVIALGDTYCARVVDTQALVAVEHAGRSTEFARHPVYDQMKLEAYIAAPIRVNGELYGTLNFSDTQVKRPGFSEEDREFVEMLALGLGFFIERDQLEQGRTSALRLMRENIDLFESAFRFSAIGIALVGTDGRWLRVNQALCDIVGYSEEELLKIDFQRITHPDDLDTDLGYLQEMLEGKRDSYRMEKRYFHRDGHVVWILLSVSMVRDEEGNPRYFVSQIQDISEQKRVVFELERSQKELEQANRTLMIQATVDPLTGVLNRRAFNERLEEELQRMTRTVLPVSLLMLDVDHFKRYNDTFGHPAGDAALRAIADKLRELARVNDVVARFGGEEFAVVLPNTDTAGCKKMAERLRAAVEAIDGLDGAITASVGGATLNPPRGRTARPDSASLVKQADEALYHAKAGGRNLAVHFSDSESSQ